MLNENDFFDLISQKKKIYFAGIGGISMSSLAFCAFSAGCSVAGYDATESDLTRKLEKAGISVSYTFDPADFANVSLLVYTGALRDSDPVLSYPRSLGIPEMTRGEFLGLWMKRSENPIGVSGTHGKSTTTGMLASIFLAAGVDPTVMVGAEMRELDGAYRVGKGKDFLFEACEYKDSFLRFYPRVAVILNVEHDHDDYFPTLQDVIRSFVRFADIAKSGHAVINFDNPGALAVAEKTVSPVFLFSRKEKKDLWSENEKENGGFYSFDIVTPAGRYCRVALNVPGEHNVSNALAAASAALLSGVPGEAVEKGLAAFRGVRRRFEKRGVCRNRPVFDDYAHHPDEIRATLTAARKMGLAPLTVVYQPHTYSRTKTHWQGFIDALSLADEVILADIYAARETPIPGVTSENLAKAIPGGKYLGDLRHIADYLLSQNKDGVVIVMGAGNIISLTDLVLTDE